MDASKFIVFFLTACVLQCSCDDDATIACRIDGGEKGSKGERGPPGASGQCNLEPTNSKDNDKGDAANRPLKTTCKNAPTSSQKPQWMGKNELESFKIECKETEKLTCIAQDSIVNKKRTTIEVNANSISGKQTLWWNALAEHPFMEMYELRSTQIMWLQGIANSAHQTLRIYGLDIKAQNSEGENSIVQLLTWNDVVIDQKPTPNSLFHYTMRIPEACIEKNSTTEPCEYVDIIVKSNQPARIPITDIVFNIDLSKKSYKIAVEIEELCFE